MWVEVALNIPSDQFFTYAVPENLISQVQIGKRVEVFFKSARKSLTVPKRIDQVKFETLILEQISAQDQTILLNFYKKTDKQYQLQIDLNENEEKQIKTILKTIRGRLTGVIIKISRQKPAFKTLEILKILDPQPVFSEFSLEIAQWISDYYGCFLCEALFLFVPGGKHPSEISVKTTQTQALIELNEEQEKVYQILKNKLNQFYSALIFGVTGSGKTEIYRSLVRDVVQSGKQALVLVPEISLTPQTVERFSSLFGEAGVALIHSKMTQEQKLANYYRIKNQKAQIILGPRSALFTPMDHLGLIIIDEEHEHSYKSSETPRYHAKQVAFKIAKKMGIPLILGSATPSLETFYAAKTGKIHLFTLKKRYADIQLPEVKIIDLKKEKGDFSKELVQKVFLMKQNQHQSILFMNRRGFSPFILCKSCGYKFVCPNCSVSLTYHKKHDAYSCHYCGYSIKSPSECPSCKNKNLSLMGLGTEKLEEEIGNLFHNLKIVRMDRDTTSKKGSHETIIQKVKSGEADILIGTQMIAKGLNFDKARLVGVILADITLNLPDFRSGENTFSLLTQVAGRSGRKAPGEVLIQTYVPQNYIIQMVKNHDYEGFYDKEIELRKKYQYPPFTRIIRLVFRGEDLNTVQLTAQAVSKKLSQYSTNLSGPVPCALEKINKNYRQHLFIRVQNPLKWSLILKQIIQENLNKKVYIEIDVDPVNML